MQSWTGTNDASAIDSSGHLRRGLRRYFGLLFPELETPQVSGSRWYGQWPGGGPSTNSPQQEPFDCTMVLRHVLEGVQERRIQWGRRRCLSLRCCLVISPMLRRNISRNDLLVHNAANHSAFGSNIGIRVNWHGGYRSWRRRRRTGTHIHTLLSTHSKSTENL